MGMIFKNRTEAGRLLGEKLKKYKDKNALVLALPRGGVPVALEIATILDAELGVVITRKIGAPGNPELAIGSVADDGTAFLNNSIIADLGIETDYIKHKIKQVKNEIAEYIERYIGESPVPEIAGRTVIIVDDGIATGYTILAAIKTIMGKHPKELVIAVPVGPRDSIDELQQTTGCSVITLMQPVFFIAVGQYYEDFRQVSDEEVSRLLRHYRK